jgi:two-component system copper resistance phosphate regulon response regulator CusR
MRLLLVEDEKKVSAFVSRGLKAEGYAVDTAVDGGEAFDHLAAVDYDLILLDLSLAGESGSEILQRFRKKNQSVPVLVLTARDALAEKVKHFELGADDYLTKPFAFAELLMRIKALLRRGPIERASTLKISQLELDRITRRVSWNGEEIKLTSKEFSLLEYLMLNPGRVLSRTMIVEHVWDQSFEGMINIVDVYIRLLRRKIDEKYERRLIQTVRGVGYSIGSDEA